MRFNAKRRAGLTLTEVLVSIFIMSIGLMALMSLFPIGALRMAQAMKDDRCSQAGANAERVFRVLWKQAWLDGNGALNPDAVAYGTAAGQPAFAALDNRNLGGWGAPNWFGPALNTVGNAQAFPVVPTATGAAAALLASQQFQGPGMPVYLDPIGFNTQSTVSNLRRSWVGGSQQIPRRDIALASGNPASPFLLSRDATRRFSVCSLLDEFTYDQNGRADFGTGNVKREGNYNYAWMIQRPRNGVRHEVNLQVAIYRRRPAADTATNEQVFSTVLNNAANPIVEFSNTNATIPANGVRITYATGARPSIRVGAFLLNASTYRFNEQGGTGPYIRQYADFHRIVSIADASANVIDIELATPTNMPPTTATVLSGGGNRTVVQGQSRNTVMFLENLVEVFDRGTISAFDKPAP